MNDSEDMREFVHKIFEIQLLVLRDGGEWERFLKTEDEKSVVIISFIGIWEISLSALLTESMRLRGEKSGQQNHNPFTKNTKINHILTKLTYPIYYSSYTYNSGESS